MKIDSIDWDGCSAIRFALKRDLKCWREAAQCRRLKGTKEDRKEFIENALEIRGLLKRMVNVKELKVAGRF